MITNGNSFCNPWYVAAGLACFIGGALAAHLFLTDSFKVKKRKKDLPPGLVNIGSTTCYCNTVLQCLAPLENLRIWLGKISNRLPSAQLYKETNEMLQALSNFCEPDVLLLSSETLLSYLQVQDRFQYFTQQDCHEFFQLLCEKLQMVGNSLGKSYDPGLQPSSHISSSHGFPKFPLSGRLSSRLRCSACNTIFPTTVEPFVALSLVVPVNSRPAKPHLLRCGNFTSLTDLLASFTNDELLADAVCEKCKAKYCLRKQTKIFSVPQIMCLHISRSGWANESPTKNASQITFSDLIDLAPFMQYKPSDAYLYRLRAVVVHYGALSSSGHFIAYRQSPSGRRWCYASDEDVRFVDKETVLSSEPYMLFYERFVQQEMKSNIPTGDIDLMRKML